MINNRKPFYPTIKKNPTSTKINPSDVEKLNNWKLKISATQGKPLTNQETIRRIFNIPSIEDILIKDAEAKKKLGL